ncbi:MAG: lipopolysaccharide kinase InaA family protein [Phycisphaerae bacterium]|jgi:serine/threonine protein kinase
MIYRKTLIADNFPSGFESSDVQVPDGIRASFEKLASSRFACVLRCNAFFGAKVYSLILKQYFNRNIFDFFKALIISSRAERAFKAGQMLSDNGFLAPPAVACGRQFLMTQEIRNSTPLYKILEVLPSPQKQKMIEQFARTIGRMHDKGIFHGDLRLGNVLVKSAHCHFERSPFGAEPRNLLNKDDSKDNFDFYFLDNERTKKFNNLPWRLRIKNLVQAFMVRENLTDADKACFFASYFAQQQTQIDKDKLTKEVVSKTAKRLAKKETNRE